MYELSRDLYRELRPDVIAQAHHPGRAERLLLAECEHTVQRLARDLHRYPRPARDLFRRIRFLFPVSQQLRVFGVIERHITDALDELQSRLAAEPGRVSALRCAAVNRRGTPCGREPLRGSRFCPSHRHLGQPLPTPMGHRSVA